MEKLKRVGLFTLIAPLYSLFFKHQVNNFSTIFDTWEAVIFKKQKQLQILDIGCGTGALLSILSARGHHCTGVDLSSGMLRQAGKRLKGREVTLVQGDPMDRNLFSEGQFDIVTSSYVLHGLPRPARRALLRRAFTLARQRVVIIDYRRRGGRMTDLIEWLERGDYFRFVEEFPAELAELTDTWEVRELDGSGGLFVVEK